MSRGMPNTDESPVPACPTFDKSISGPACSTCVVEDIRISSSYSYEAYPRKSRPGIEIVLQYESIIFCQPAVVLPDRRILKYSGARLRQGAQTQELSKAKLATKILETTTMFRRSRLPFQYIFFVTQQLLAFVLPLKMISSTRVSILANYPKKGSTLKQRFSRQIGTESFENTQTECNMKLRFERKVGMQSFETARNNDAA